MIIIRNEEVPQTGFERQRNSTDLFTRKTVDIRQIGIPCIDKHILGRYGDTGTPMITLINPDIGKTNAEQLLSTFFTQSVRYLIGNKNLHRIFLCRSIMSRYRIFHRFTEILRQRRIGRNRSMCRYFDGRYHVRDIQSSGNKSDHFLIFENNPLYSFGK